ncbi:MAG TPA: pseudouridine synthase [Solirubrobacteraceae bacterium]
MRLVKFLATAGVASRRASEEIVRAQRVTVNGAIVTDPARDVGAQDAIAVDGHPVRHDTERVVYMVNKPLGVVSTADDPQHRPTVVSLVASGKRLYPVGRLDIDTTGLILLTNDGELAHRLMHPSFEVPRTYRVVVTRPPIADATLRALRRGVDLEDGRTAPARVRRLGGRGSDTLELTIHEGRKRQVKRMCDAVGHPVRRLTRVSFGPLELGDLAPGAHRRLTAAELGALTGGPPASVGPSGRRAPVASSSARATPSPASPAGADPPPASGS